MSLSADYMVSVALSFGGLEGGKAEKSRGSDDSSMSMGKAGKMGKGGWMMSMGKAGKGGWMDPRLEQFFPWFIKELERKRLKCYVLFDHEVKANNHPVTKHVGPHYRFFPKEYSSNASIEVFGDRVNLVTNIHFGGLEEDFSFTVIVNPQLADAFRTWFNFMWLSCKAPPTARGGSKHSSAP
jgi:hypothetical protein